VLSRKDDKLIARGLYFGASSVSMFSLRCSLTLEGSNYVRKLSECLIFKSHLQFSCPFDCFC
jgi:hypothetical protein